MNRSLRRLYAGSAVAFGLLILMLGYWQVVRASALNDRPGNEYAAQRERLVDRGRIISADGVVLARSARSRVQGQTVFTRVYPHGTLAPHVVGYASTRVGSTGLESVYNRYLAGSYGTEPLLQRLNLKEKRGADVRITLDTRVQRAAQEALGTNRGAVVAIDPRTGAVRAMVSQPGFDLGDVAGRRTFDRITASDGSPLLNRATSGRYPPGSTFKVVTATSALDSNLFTPQSRFVDTGTFRTAGPPIRNFGGARFGPHTLTTALTKSINTTFASIGTSLGEERLGATMTRFGFGDRPAIDLPQREVLPSGRVGRGGRTLPNAEDGIDVARIAIGQERLAVSPLQMAMVASTIASGGVVRAPFLMRRVTDRGGETVREQGARELGRVASPEVMADLTAMMRRVVEEGTGTAAALSSSGVAVAGKTGTAETGVEGRNAAWFIGFAPAERPVVAVAVVVEGTPGTGGVVAAPVAARVMRAAVDAERP
ncbi:MAG: penicillin-binding protein 2 [Actinomycetota bacterium]